MNRLPDTKADFDDPDDQPIDFPGGPLSQAVIRGAATAEMAACL